MTRDRYRRWLQLLVDGNQNMIRVWGGGIYEADDFYELAKRVLAASNNDPAARAFQRQLSSATDEQRPDGQGRITLSVDHRRYAGLAKECVVIGNMSHLEIWDSQTWRDYQDEHEENYSSVGFDALDTVL